MGSVNCRTEGLTRVSSWEDQRQRQRRIQVTPEHLHVVGRAVTLTLMAILSDHMTLTAGHDSPYGTHGRGACITGICDHMTLTAT